MKRNFCTAISSYLLHNTNLIYKKILADADLLVVLYFSEPFIDLIGLCEDNGAMDENLAEI